MNFKFRMIEESIKIRPGTVLSIADPKIFSDVAWGLADFGTRKDIQFFDNSQKQLLAKDMMIVSDFLSYLPNNTTIQKSIISDIEEEINSKPHLKIELEEHLSQVYDILTDEILDHELDLEIDEFQLGAILKFLKIRINNLFSDVPGKLNEVIRVYQYLQGKIKILVFINVCSFLTKKELEDTIEYIRLSNLKVLFIEPRDIPEITDYLLDEDYFLQKR